jgi:hypothetical protein
MMKAKVITYGGVKVPAYYVHSDAPPAPMMRTVKHWQLIIDGLFIADTSVPEQAELFKRIAAKIND